jgi:hypothetical protein
MTLQQQQLDELAEWMTNMEDKIQSQGPMGSDLPEIKQQIQSHKVCIHTYKNMNAGTVLEKKKGHKANVSNKSIKKSSH